MAKLFAEKEKKHGTAKLKMRDMKMQVKANNARKYLHVSDRRRCTHFILQNRL